MSNTDQRREKFVIGGFIKRKPRIFNSRMKVEKCNDQRGNVNSLRSSIWTSSNFQSQPLRKPVFMPRSSKSLLEGVGSLVASSSTNSSSDQNSVPVYSSVSETPYSNLVDSSVGRLSEHMTNDSMEDPKYSLNILSAGVVKPVTGSSDSHVFDGAPDSLNSFCDRSSLDCSGIPEVIEYEDSDYEAAQCVTDSGSLHPVLSVGLTLVKLSFTFYRHYISI